MTIQLPDDVLSDAGLTERDVLIEAACHLFDVGKVALWPAARLAGLTRPEFESELLRRRIAVYRPTSADVEVDASTIRAMES